MDYNNALNALMVLVTQAVLGSYVMLLTEFREPQRVWMGRWIAVIVLTVAINVALILFANFWQLYTRLGVLTVTVPYILFTLWCSRYRGLRVVFNICTCLWLGCIGNAAGMIAQALLPESPGIDIVVRLIAYLALYVVLRSLKNYYQRMLLLLDRGWGILCLISIFTFLTVLYMANNLLVQNPLIVSFAILGVTLVCTCAYGLIYLFFGRVLREYELRNIQQMMDVQIGAIERQLAATSAAEEAIRIQRHDLRHQWTLLSVLIGQGDKEAIKDFIGAVQKQLDEAAPACWCKNAMLNAVFTCYFAQAKQQGITVEAKLAIGEQLPVPAAELSMVFANALENAITSCLALPLEQRKIICKCIEHPCLMLQVENPYQGEVYFDSEGLPIAASPGHGIGTRSIAAFCQKHHAVWNYQVQDGWFKLRISL